MQPLRAAKDAGDIWLGSRAAGSTGTQVNTAAFWNKKIEDVAADDVFFHEYFQTVGKEAKESKARASKAAQDADGQEGDEEDDAENEVWKALVSTQPDIEGGDDSDDMGFDLDEDDMASLDGSSPALSLEDDSDGGVSIEGDDDDDLDENADEIDGDDDDLVPFGDDESEEEKPKGSKNNARRKMLKSLPMFASVDDYAEMLADEEEM